MVSTNGRTTWRDHPWQLLREGPMRPLLHMALEDVLIDEVNKGRRPPMLRIWEWASNAVVIGRFQSVRNEIDPEGAQRHTMEIVRRISGGGAMFIEPDNTITYSIYAPRSLVAGMGTTESYAFLDQWVLDALAATGVRAWYQPINDIVSAAGKIAGAAQLRRSDAVLHHVTMAYNIDNAKMLEVLRIGRPKLSDKGTRSAVKHVDPLRSQTGLSREAIIDQLVATFRAQHGLTDSQLTPDELQRAETLIASKFGTEQWLYDVP